MKLFLVRHGEAEPYQTQDDTRQLTARGVKQAMWVAQAIADRIRPDVFLVSPYQRAQQTLQPLRQLFPEVPVHVVQGITPDDDAKMALTLLAQYQGQTMVVVCHMNIVAHLASLLTQEVFDPFGLAELRMFEQDLLGLGMSTERYRLIPPAFSDGV
jgi:phosphohistidine phosphatase